MTIPLAHPMEFYKDFLEFYARATLPAHYLEIGAQGGWCFRRVAPFCTRSWAIEPNPTGELEALFSVLSNTRIAGAQLHVGTSDEFFANTTGLDPVIEPFDLVFIDGDHSKDQVWKDINNALRVLADDGLIVVHDLWPPTETDASPTQSGDGYKLLPQLNKMRGVNIVTLYVTYGLTLINNRIDEPTWAVK